MLFMKIFLFLATAITTSLGGHITNTAHNQEGRYNDTDNRATNYDVQEVSVTGELNPDEIDGILLMREEEKLARDVYQELGEHFAVQAFTNIAKSEQRHMDAMAKLINDYQLTDPVTDNTRGVFTNPELAKLYSELTTQGQASEEAALKVGALIEELDIYDLHRLGEATTNQNILRVYDELTRGSRNHLRSFTRLLAEQKATYTPTYLSPDEYTLIIASDTERGNEEGGNGQRGGKGRF